MRRRRGIINKIITLSIGLSFIFVFGSILYKICIGVSSDSTGFLMATSVIATTGGIFITGLTGLQLRDTLLAK